MMYTQPNRRSFRTLLSILYFTGGACSCAWMGDPIRVDPGNCVRVVVENNSLADVNVFVQRDEKLFRLGTVMSMQSELFILPHRMLGGAMEYRLHADPIGSLDEFTTQRLEVLRDATVYWMIEPSSWLSYVMIR